MASTSILEQIAAAIATQLATLTVVGGYQLTIASVKRPAQWEELDFADLLAVVTQGDRTRAETEDLGWEQWFQDFEIALLVMESEATETAVETRMNLFDAEAHKCLSVDPTFGGLAIDSRITGVPEMPLAGTGFKGIILTLNVHYRHLDGDPYADGA